MPRKVKNKNKLLTDDRTAPAETESLDFHVNEDYAKRFEHNKRREELHRLQAKHGDVRHKARRAEEEDESTSSSDDEDEDDGQISEDQEAQILDTLLRIKRRDPVIYQPDVHFFEEGEEDAAADGAADGPTSTASIKTRKPMYLKDVLAKQVLEHGPEASSSGEEDEGQRGRVGHTRPPRVYDKEQEDLRRDFLSAAQAVQEDGEDDAFGGVLKKKKKPKKSKTDAAGDGEDAAEADEEVAPAEAGRKQKKRRGEQQPSVDKLVDQVFGHEGADEGDRFLKTFILQRGWIDVDDAARPASRRRFTEDGEDGASDEDDDAGDGSGDLEGDDQFLEEVDRYEAAYNFRYEEPGSTKISTHPRVVEGTVRKEDDRRKLQRQAKSARRSEAAQREEEEVKRLKNLKKHEIEDRLSKVRRVAGLKSGASRGGLSDAVMGKILDGDFDPDQWDKTMAQAFGDEYYEEEDAAADELEHDADMAAFGDHGEGEEEGDDGEEPGGEEEAEDGGGEGFRHLHKKLTSQAQGAADGGQGAAQAAEHRASLQQLLSEYYQLDYEDNVGGVRTRFRYKEVPSNSFGLAVDDILRLDDKDLNQVVGLKRLAPYREDFGKERPNYKALQAITAAGAFNNNAGGDKRGGRRQQQPHQQQRQPAAAGQGGRWAGATGRGAQQQQQQQDARGNGASGADRRPQQKRPRETAAAGAATDGAAGRPPQVDRGKHAGQAPAAAAAASDVPSTSGAGASGAGAQEPPAKVAKAGPDSLAAARLASYGKLSLRKDGGGGAGGRSGGGGGGGKASDGGSKAGGGGKTAGGNQAGDSAGQKSKGRRSDVEGPTGHAAAQPAVWPVGGLQSDAPKLSKAAKKNMKRHAKRAAGAAATDA